MLNGFETAIQFVADSPAAACGFVFAVALGEALAVIGLFIPGTPILFLVGALIAGGHLPLGPLLLAAMLGAIVGDGVSFAVGRRFRSSIRAAWPFTRWPALIAGGEAFFLRHGGKSVAIGRFLPAVRAMVPLAAGTLGMATGRFYVANVISAVLWAPAHMLPGVLLGRSLAWMGFDDQATTFAVIAAAVLLGCALWVIGLVRRQLKDGAS